MSSINNASAPFPSHLCPNCLDQLMAAHSFRNKFIHSNTLLDRFGNETALEKTNPSSSYGQSQQIRAADNNVIYSEQQQQEESTLSPPLLYECDLCSKKFRQKSSLLPHFEHRHHKRQPADQHRLKCSICHKQFSFGGNLKRHLIGHSIRSEQLVCDECPAVYLNAADLYDHLKMHRAVQVSATTPILECDLCQERTTSLSRFNEHMRSKHRGRTVNGGGGCKPFRCTRCPVRCTTKQALQRHIDNIHENNRRGMRPMQKNYLCTLCGKAYLSPGHLKQHQRCHTGERPFRCERCGKSFAQKSALTTHSYIHTGERPYACEVCAKRYTQYGHLYEHRKTHTALYEHGCSVCGRRFKVKGNLTVHMRTHSGLRPYKCCYCDRRFAQGSKMRQHVARAHDHADDDDDTGE